VEPVAYVVVFVAAAVPWLEVLLVVPAGIVAGLPVGPTALVAVAGNVATLVPLVLAGDRIRTWWRARRHAGCRGHHDAVVVGAPRPRGQRASRVLVRYGLPGLAAFGPLLTGVHVAAVVALAAGAPRRATLWWLSGGVAVWAVLAALATITGLNLFFEPDALPQLPGLAS